MKCGSSFIVTAAIALWATFAAAAGPVPVKVGRAGDQWQLLRDGQPYFIKGAGGSGSKPLLVECGGNSFRTWGADDAEKQLDEAQKLGLTVTVGIWMRHEGDHGFHYADTKAVTAQFANAKAAVEKLKNHPALLIWAVGNEMEGYKDGGDPAVWKAVQDVAAMIKKIDPNHPTMTVIAEIGGKRIESIDTLCPDIDIVGINSYGGVASVGERYKTLHPTKPYVVTEFGPPGTWEGWKNNWGAAMEFPSTKKGDIYRTGYEKGVLAEKQWCLGSYVFTWGYKQEATATWFGMFLADGSQTEAIHTMAELWSGKAPANRCPQIDMPKLAEGDTAKPGGTIHATVALSDPDGDPLKVEWVLAAETKMVGIAGETQKAPPAFPAAIVHRSDHDAEITMPAEPGTYRLFVYAHDDHGNAPWRMCPSASNSDPTIRTECI